MKTVYVLEDPQVWKQLLLAQSNQYGYGLPGYGGIPHQRGTGLPGYSGYPRQRGSGLGSFFRGLFRMAMPVIKRAAKAFGKEALKTGVSVLADVARGQDVLPSLETHGREAVATLADKTLNYLKRPAEENQEGGGSAKRARRSPQKKRKAPARKRKAAKKKPNKKPAAQKQRKRSPKRKQGPKRKRTQRRKPIKAAKRKQNQSVQDIFGNVSA